MSTIGGFGRQRAEPGFIVLPRLEVPLPVWQKVMTFIQACPTEINGFGYIDRIGNTFMMTDVIILEQVATTAGVEVSEETLHRHLYELTRRGGDAGRMRFQWHSHVDMEAYFSSTDLANIESYPGDWMISFVGNKRGEYELRLDVYRPFRVWTPVELKINLPPDPQLVTECRGEIHNKVRTPGFWRRPRVQPTTPTQTPLEATSVHNGTVR